MTGVWRPSALLLVGSEPDLLLSMPRLPSSRVSLPAESCAASSGRLSDLLDLDVGCRLAAAELSAQRHPLRRPTSTQKATLRRRNPCPTRLKPNSCPGCLADPALARIVVSTSRLAGSLVLEPASPPTRRLRVLMSPLPFSRWPCSVASACRCGITIPPATCVAKFWTVGRRVHLCLPRVGKSLVSSSPRRPDPGGTDLDLSSPPGPSSPTVAGRRPADVWVPRGVSGLADVWRFLGLVAAPHLPPLLGHPVGG